MIQYGLGRNQKSHILSWWCK